MTMTKKHYKEFADAIAEIRDETEREKVIDLLSPVFRADNWRFERSRFEEWIRRKVNGESTKGLG